MNKLNLTLVYILIFTIISSGLAYKIVLSAYASYDHIYEVSYFSRKSTPTNKNDLIKVFSPKPNELAQSPLLVTGEARGNWYFEASFPVKLFDANNNEITLTPGYIMATGDPADDGASWMTTDFVPFQATLTFSQPATSTGTLVLQKDNPSGLPENDDSIFIPVKFE